MSSKSIRSYVTSGYKWVTSFFGSSRRDSSALPSQPFPSIPQEETRDPDKQEALQKLNDEKAGIRRFTCSREDSHFCFEITDDVPSHNKSHKDDDQAASNWDAEPTSSGREAGRPYTWSNKSYSASSEVEGQLPSAWSYKDDPSAASSTPDYKKSDISQIETAQSGAGSGTADVAR